MGTGVTQTVRSRWLSSVRALRATVMPVFKTVKIVKTTLPARRVIPSQTGILQVWSVRLTVRQPQSAQLAQSSTTQSSAQAATMAFLWTVGPVNVSKFVATA